MKEYHKIQTVFKRDMEHGGKALIEGQYAKPEFEYLANNPWEFTEKVDGTNIRVKWLGDTIVFGGTTDNAQLPANLVARLHELFPSPDVFRAAFPECDGGVCLYGEGYGAGIQKGGKYCTHQDFVLFDVNVAGWWLRRDDVKDVSEKMSLDAVPVVGEGTLADCVKMARSGFQSSWGEFTAEGIVARPTVELCTRNGERIITKIKHRDFQA
ncbi:MAG: RNA ligase family protein [Candidatus Omnitrophota bacterium]